jgi:hypothetical protein
LLGQSWPVVTIRPHAKSQMQTQEMDSISPRVYYSTRGRQLVGQGRQKVVIQISVRQVQDGIQDQGQDRQEGQNWEE